VSKSEFQQNRDIKRKRKEKREWYFSLTLLFSAIVIAIIFIVTGEFP